LKFEGYKYKFRLNISHGLNSETTKEHHHTIEITLYIDDRKKDFESYTEVEKMVDRYLIKYSGKYLNETPPFTKIDSTIENIGKEFYKQIKSIASDNSYNLISLEISEIPTRVYVVSDLLNESRKETTLREKKLAFLIDEVSSSKVRKVTIVKPASNIIKKDEPIEETSKEIIEEIVVNDSDKSKINSNKSKLPKLFVACIFILVSAVVLVSYIQKQGIYPTGFDVFGHLFKSNLLYENLKEGNLYPLYTNLWYNGLQPFRYWAPLPYYLLALLQFIANGDVMNSYLFFVGISFAVGALGWIKFGVKHNRILLATVLGFLWFFLPDNARVFFSEGNIPRMVIAMILPYLFYYIWEFIEYKRKCCIFPVIIFMCLIALCHVMVASMVGIGTFIYVLIYSVANKKFKESSYLILGMLLSFAIVGVWLYAALHGGLLTMDSSATSEVMKDMTYEATVSLNPFIRLQGNGEIYYFGLSVIIVAALGLFLSNKKSVAGFLTAIIIFFGTTTALIPFISKLPLNQLFWMIRFSPIAYGFFLIAILEWKKCKKIFICIFCFILILDAIPTFNLKLHEGTMGTDVKKSSEGDLAKDYFLEDSKNTTNQRLANYDLSKFGSFPSYYLSTGDNKIQYSYGWAWQGAATASNIVLQNTALEGGYFNFLFDRSIEIGTDTVVIRKAQFKDLAKALNELQVSGKRSGYYLEEENDYSYVFHKDTPKVFGVITEYSGLAIGKSASQIALEFPSFKIGDSLVLDDYTIDDLKVYKRIYLSGFEYNNKGKVEELVRNITNNGVKVYIDMNRIPYDSLTNRMNFLSVTGQTITFENNYPNLIYKNNIIKSDDFKDEYSTWNTVYLDNLKKVDGYANLKGEKLDFLGSGENENMVFIGFNVLFHSMETQDTNVLKLLSEVFEIDKNTLPNRKIIAIDIGYEKNKIVINSHGDNVNTTIAYQDNFKSKENITNANNLLLVDSGTTEIDITYPYFTKGLFISLGGIIGTIILSYFILKKNKGETYEE